MLSVINDFRERIDELMTIARGNDSKAAEYAKRAIALRAAGDIDAHLQSECVEYHLREARECRKAASKLLRQANKVLAGITAGSPATP